ncbi:MAG: LLM class flavin-dependent oxidoreductase [Alphaproteobacteria bacterium]|jgi:alkanesulfonate monooxygenase SsuD/methylene tetrahydromethanopterin reductase-like flavin-dependent oxidoreductase (luciferase family)|nr:LLM class flavin-dependent oxidoreductase [Alphaproteobacteria bacterium]
MTVEHPIGLVLGSAVAPQHIQGAAATAEACGFDEIWLAEDYFFTGGVAGASLVLGATSHITVGIGVVSAVARHPALLAMELSTLARVYEDRIIAGIGLGVPAWVRQMGLHPQSPLSALRECVTTTKALMRGETVDVRGEVFTFNDVTLVYPETGAQTPVRMGVIGPKMLQLSGEVADGSVLSVSAGQDYVRWAKQRIEEGRVRGGRTDRHPITVFAIYAVDDDGDAARATARARLAFYRQLGSNGLTDVYGVSDELNALVKRGGYEAVLEGMPDQWVEDLTIAGTPEECAAKISAFYAAGADSIALFPAATDRIDEIVRLTADGVLPRL